MGRAGIGWGGWGIALAGGVVATGLLLVLARSPQATSVKDAAPARTGSVPVGIARVDGEAADAVLREDAMMRDPAPLFLPTRWNASENILPAEGWREPATAFRGYEPKFSFRESGLDVAMPQVVAVPERVADAFALERPRRPFEGFGQRASDAAPLPERAAFLKVVSARDGDVVIAEPLSAAYPPGEAAWQPLEFLLAVDAQGAIQPPVLTASSEVAAVDGYFQEHVLSGLHLGERLSPGVYRVGIGP